MTQVHTHRGERVCEHPTERRWQIHAVKGRDAHKHTPGWPFLMFVLVCNWYWEFFSKFIFWSHAWQHARTHL